MKKIYNRFFSAKNVMRNAFLALMVAPVMSFGQLYVQIGTGTATNSTTGYPCPLGNWYDGLREQHLYTASELQAAGYSGGSITEIAWDVSAMPSTVGTLTNYTIYVRATSATSLTSFQTITGTADFQGNTNVTTGWNTFTLNSPFIWNGTDNILVQVCYENSCASYTRNPEVKYSTATFTSSIYYRADCTSGMCTQTGFPSTSSNRPNIRFTAIPPVVDDAGVSEITSPSVGNCTLGSLPAKVILNNMGSGWLTSCTVNWSVNGSTQTPVSFADSVAPTGGTSDTVNLGNFNFSDGDVLCVWTTNPNGVQDSFPQNDTICTTIYEALGGTYTVGVTSTDFTTIQEAANALMERGVCSATTFNLIDSVYNERPVLGAAPGASMMNNIVFQPDPQNMSVVEIMSAPNSDSNFVIEFNGAMFTSFDNVTVDGSTGGSYGGVISFTNSEYCGLSNSVINGIVTTSTSNRLYTINGTGGNGNMLMYSQVNGGSYGLYYSGGTNHSFMNNEFVDPYFYGVYLTGIDDAIFNYNQLNASTAYRFAYGLYCNSLGGATQIIGNYLDWPGYGGLYMREMNGRVDAQPTVANNMIRSGNGSYYAYGAYMWNSGYVNFVNNTVAKDASSGYGFYGIYVAGGANKLINNLFYDPNGSSSYYNMYISGAFSVSESDYNNVYSTQRFGYLSGVQSTLADWQTNTGFDMNSTTIDPGFPSFDTLRHCNDSLDGTGTPLSFITDDFDGDGRNPTNPDVGADEWVGSAPGSYSAGEDQIVCDGKTVEIGLAVTGGSFLWSTGDTTSTVVVNSSGTYTVAMTSDCGAIHTDTVEVTDVTPTASFTITDVANTFLTIDAVNNSQNGMSYMWTVTGATVADTIYSEHLTHIVPDNGPYEVCLTTYNDCDTVSTCDTWQGVVSVDEIELSNLISLMPNPATDVLNIQFEGVEGDVTVEMTNIQGQIVYTERFMDVSGSSVKTVNVSSLNKGMYIVKFITDGDFTTKQVIVQ